VLHHERLEHFGGASPNGSTALSGDLIRQT
jgi:hypothetical protein